MNKVLIALDYNPSAQKVAEIGHALAHAMNAQTILLHVTSDFANYSSSNYDPIMGFVGFSSLDTAQTYTPEEIKKAAQAYLDKSKRHLGDNEIQTVVKKGNYGEAISNTAAELHADLIVMGTHSRRGLKKILIGSVMENVLRHSSIPLLIIPIKAIKEKQTYDD